MTEFQPENNNDTDSGTSPLSFFKRLNPLVYTLFVLMIIFFLYQMIGGVLAFAAVGSEFDKNINLMRVILSFGQFMFILAPTIFFARLQTADIRSVFRLKMPGITILLFAIIGIVTVQPFLQGIMFFQDKLITAIPYVNDVYKSLKDFFDQFEALTMKIVKAHSPMEFATIVFVIAITPAICEEALFRGFVLTNFQRAAKLSVSIFLSAFLFAVYHFQPLNIIPLLVLGLYLGFITYYSNSIIPSVVCHFLNNFFAAYYLFKYNKQDIETPQITNSEISDIAIFAVISFVLFVISLVMIKRLGTLRIEGKEI